MSFCLLVRCFLARFVTSGRDGSTSIKSLGSAERLPDAISILYQIRTLLDLDSE